MNRIETLVLFYIKDKNWFFTFIHRLKPAKSTGGGGEDARAPQRRRSDHTSPETFHVEFSGELLQGCILNWHADNRNPYFIKLIKYTAQRYGTRPRRYCSQKHMLPQTRRWHQASFYGLSRNSVQPKLGWARHKVRPSFFHKDMHANCLLLHLKKYK